MLSIGVIAGLPNITGSTSGARNGGENVTGAFYTTGSVSTYGGGRYHMGIVAFDASRSSTIYGKSNTVTPLSKKCLFLIKY